MRTDAESGGLNAPLVKSDAGYGLFEDAYPFVRILDGLCVILILYLDVHAYNDVIRLSLKAADALNGDCPCHMASFLLFCFLAFLLNRNDRNSVIALAVVSVAE